MTDVQFFSFISVNPELKGAGSSRQSMGVSSSVSSFLGGLWGFGVREISRGRRDDGEADTRTAAPRRARGKRENSRGITRACHRGYSVARVIARPASHASDALFYPFTEPHDPGRSSRRTPKNHRRPRSAKTRGRLRINHSAAGTNRPRHFDSGRS